MNNSINQKMAKVDLLFLCGGKDFHAMDKFKLVFDTIGQNRVILVTDTIEGEAQKSLVKDCYLIEKLFIIDKFTPNYQSKRTHLWRNIIKLIFLPIQAKRLRQIYRHHKPAVVHAVPMYYMLLCRFSGIPYVGTPQADEVLERPSRSLIYRFFASKAIKSANQIIVDSMAMKRAIENNFHANSVVIKNGFDTSRARSSYRDIVDRTKIISIRGIQSNYQTLEIIRARDRVDCNFPIDFVYPFYDVNYLNDVKKEIQPADQLHGLLTRDDLYQLMGRTVLAVSIPTGDSSPRSVYEAIFCGAVVAITPMGFYDELPNCMKSRIYLVDLNNKKWFQEALDFAKTTVQSRYIPSNDALSMCDQSLLIRGVIRDIYKINIK